MCASTFGPGSMPRVKSFSKFDNRQLFYFRKIIIPRKIDRNIVYVKVVLVKSEANILDRVVVVVGIVVEGVMGAGAIATPNAGGHSEIGLN